MNWTFCGITIDWSDENENAADSIRVKHEFDSNMIDESDSQDEKQADPRISTLLGIKIDWSDDLKNARDSIRVKHEFDSNVIDESDSQDEKQADRRISTLLGIKIDWSDENENTPDSIRVKREFNSNTIDVSDPGSFPMPNGLTGRCQFRKIIESGIQTHRISVLRSAQSVTVLIEPPLTTTRRS
jgi:hypothetical protein